MPSWDSHKAEYNNLFYIFIDWIKKKPLAYKEELFLQKSPCRQLGSTLDHYDTYIWQLKSVYLMKIFKEIFCFF